MMSWLNIGRQFKNRAAARAENERMLGESIFKDYSGGIERQREVYQNARAQEKHVRGLESYLDATKPAPAHDNFSTLTDRGGRPSSWS